MKNSFLIFLVFALFYACSEKPPIPEERLILIYTDLMFTQDTLLITSENVDSIKAEIFSRHAVTEEDYRETIDIYNRTPEIWENFFNKVLEYVESLKTIPAKSDSISS